MDKKTMKKANSKQCPGVNLHLFIRKTHFVPFSCIYLRVRIVRIINRLIVCWLQFQIMRTYIHYVQRTMYE